MCTVHRIKHVMPRLTNHPWFSQMQTSCLSFNSKPRMNINCCNQAWAYKGCWQFFLTDSDKNKMLALYISARFVIFVRFNIKARDRRLSATHQHLCSVSRYLKQDIRTFSRHSKPTNDLLLIFMLTSSQDKMDSITFGQSMAVCSSLLLLFMLSKANRQLAPAAFFTVGTLNFPSNTYWKKSIKTFFPKCETILLTLNKSSMKPDFDFCYETKLTRSLLLYDFLLQLWSEFRFRLYKTLCLEAKVVISTQEMLVVIPHCT